MLEVNLLHKRSPGNDFEGGNILRSHDSDAAPHLKSRTLSKRPKESPGMGLAMNSLPIADGVQLARFDGLDDDDLTNEISPSNFDAQNLRIDMDSVSEAPTKPKVAEAVPNRYREEDEFE